MEKKYIFPFHIMDEMTIFLSFHLMKQMEKQFFFVFPFNFLSNSFIYYCNRYKKRQNMESKKKQDNWYMILDSMGRPTKHYIFASNITEARKKFKTDPHYAELWKKYGYFGSLKRVYNGGVRG